MAEEARADLGTAPAYGAAESSTAICDRLSSRCSEETNMDTGAGGEVQFLDGVVVFKHISYLLHDSGMIKESA